MDGGAWWAAVHGVSKSQTWLSDFTFIFHFHALEREMASLSSILAWRIPGTGEPGGLPSMGSHRVRHDWSDLAAYSSSLLPHLSSISSIKSYSNHTFIPMTTLKWHSSKIVMTNILPQLMVNSLTSSYSNSQENWTHLNSLSLGTFPLLDQKLWTIHCIPQIYKLKPYPQWNCVCKWSL